MDNKQAISETIAKYEQYINPSMARLLRFMGFLPLNGKRKDPLFVTWMEKNILIV